MNQFDRIFLEQRECADYLVGPRSDKPGAMMGLHDWLMEEVLVALELKYSPGGELGPTNRKGIDVLQVKD